MGGETLGLTWTQGSDVAQDSWSTPLAQSPANKGKAFHYGAAKAKGGKRGSLNFQTCFAAEEKDQLLADEGLVLLWII